MTATTPRPCTATPAAPSSPEIEMTLIGCCMMHPSAFHEAAAIIADRPVFHETRLAKLWQVVSGWYAAHPDTRPDSVWFVHELIDHEGMNTLAAECVNVSCLPANADFHAIELVRLYQLREAKTKADLISKYAAMGDMASVQKLTKEIHEMSMETQRRKQTEEQFRLGSQIDKAVKRLIGAALASYESFSIILDYLERTDTGLTENDGEYFDHLTTHYDASHDAPTPTNMYYIRCYPDWEEHKASQRTNCIEMERDTIRNYTMDACTPDEIMSYCRELTALWKEYKRVSQGNISNVITAAEMLSTPPEPERIIIEGLLAASGVWCISAQSKAGKSCLCLQAALCLAAGSPLLGMQCAPSKVLIVDLEATPGLLHKKLQAAIAHGTAAGWLPSSRDYLNNVRIIPRTSEMYTLDDIRRIVRTEPMADVLIVDPIYLIGAQEADADENSATATARMLTGLKACADDLGGASLIYTHHFAKGNQAQRDFWDRAAGSGVHARFSYALSSLTPTEDEGVLLESITRGFKMPEPLPLTLQWPCFEIAKGGSTRLKGAGGRPGNEVDLAAYVIEHGNHVKAFHTSVSLKDAASHFGVSQKTIRRHAKEQKIFIEDGFLHVQNEGENDEKIPF